MASQPIAPGTRVGKYLILSHLASGGMSEVYKARDLDLDREVALKVLPDHLAERPALVERFRREARHAAKLAHKNIITLYDWGQDQGTYYLAMEYVEGIDLHAHIEERGRLEPREAVFITVQAVRALDHAFQRGITHRDIKPSNFLLVIRQGKLRVKLADLGLARTERDDEYRVTRDGTTVGTVDYLSPEQARDGSLADVRSDIYSLGCTLYHMLAGQPPFGDGGLGERIYKHQQVEPPDVRRFNPQVSAGLWGVLRRMLAKDPDARFQTPAELLDALQGLRDNPPPANPSRLLEDTPAPTWLMPALPTPPVTQPRRPPSLAPARLTPVAASSGTLDVSAEQRRAAAGQFERARQVLTTDNQRKDYAYQLLVSCCKLDPANVVYRKTLRQVGQDMRQRGLGRWLAPINALASKAHLKAARNAGDYRKILEHGEEVLSWVPDDVTTHTEMAEAAARLGLPFLEVWLLEQACFRDPHNVEMLRSLASAYERLPDPEKALALWRAVEKLLPLDSEAAGKIKSLSGQRTPTQGTPVA